jgi:hypothetical protein
LSYYVAEEKRYAKILYRPVHIHLISYSEVS